MGRPRAQITRDSARDARVLKGFYDGALDRQKPRIPSFCWGALQIHHLLAMKQWRQRRARHGGFPTRFYTPTWQVRALAIHNLPANALKIYSK